MKESQLTIPTQPLPYLEHFPEPGQPAHRITLEQLPFRIGRSMAAHCIIYAPQVSKEHTEIYKVGAEFRIRDLGSTNGTFVNGKRVKEAPLDNGDIIHVANKEFRFAYEPNDTRTEPCPLFTELAEEKVPSSVFRGAIHLREMLTDQSVRIVFQPIVDLETRKIMGFESLGRGTHAALSPNPAELFALAAQCNLAAELSRVFRKVALEEAARVPAPFRIFFNLHPDEMTREALVESLRKLKTAFPYSRQVVLEVHEAAVADLTTMRWLSQQLKELGIGLAYDDFGAGQSRLQELAEVPPDYIKLDRGLIHDIDTSPPRREIVQALNHAARTLGVEIIAEGIETEDEARTCLRLGCHLGQGFLFGRPQPLAFHHSPTLLLARP